MHSTHYEYMTHATRTCYTHAVCIGGGVGRKDIVCAEGNAIANILHTHDTLLHA